MQVPDRMELKQRLALLSPVFLDSGARIIQAYADAGILTAIHDKSFPVAGAVFTSETTGGSHKKKIYSYYPHGPVYFSVTREGVLELDGHAGAPFQDAILEFTAFARRQNFEDTEDGATERFPPPRFLLDPDSSGLYIAAASLTDPPVSPARFMPLQQYLEERAGLFIEAFHAAR